MLLHYINDSGREIVYDVYDWDAARNVANVLLNSPIDVEYMHYEDENGQGVFNLHTFEIC